MIVVADTTPLNYLVLIGEIELHPALYQKVIIPQAVHLELLQRKTPPTVQAWASHLPAWAEVRMLQSPPSVPLDGLDAGERGAIHLALETGLDILLMDDSEGRREALRLNLRVTGTVAVLEMAAQRGLVDFRSTLERLEETNFRLSPRLRMDFLRRNF